MFEPYEGEDPYKLRCLMWELGVSFTVFSTIGSLLLFIMLLRWLVDVGMLIAAALAFYAASAWLSQWRRYFRRYYSWAFTGEYKGW